MDRFLSFLGADSSSSSSARVRVLPMIHLNLVLFSCSFWMHQPLLSQKFSQVNGTELEFGTLQSAAAVSSLVGSAVMGRIIDQFGSKSGLILTQLASCACFLVLAYATSVSLVFLSILPAFFQHGMLASQAAIGRAFATSGNNAANGNSVAFGRLALSYGVGMSVGSPIGSFVADKYGLQVAFVSAAALAMLAAGIDYWCFPDLLLLATTTTTAVDETATPRSPLGHLLAIYHVATQTPQVSLLLLMSLVGSMGPHAFRAMLPMAFVQEGYGDQKDLGMYIAYTAMLSLVANVFVVGLTVQRLGESVALFASLLVGSASFLAASAYPAWVYWIQVPQSFSFAIFYTVSSGLLSQAVRAEDQGTVSALGHATRSFNQVIGPVLGGFVMRRYEFAGVRLLAAGSLLCSAVLAARLVVVAEKTRKKV